MNVQLLCRFGFVIQKWEWKEELEAKDG